jgi:uncharacterized membrane protein
MTSLSVDTAAPTKRPTDRLWQLSLVLSLLGLAVAGYLSYTKLSNTSIACIAAVSNCDVVNSSAYAYVAGIPVAYIGFVGYLGILATLLLQKTGVAIFRQHGRLLVLLMTLGGFLFSAYLTAIEAFVLYEWCQWCVVSAILMTILFAVSMQRAWAGTVAEGALDEDSEPSEA